MASGKRIRTPVVRITKDISIGGGKPLVFFLGPCAIENRKDAVAAAKKLKRMTEKAGVKMVFGTDNGGVFPAGQNALQFAKMVEWGMTPIDAIRSRAIHPRDNVLSRGISPPAIIHRARRNPLRLTGFQSSGNGKSFRARRKR